MKEYYYLVGINQNGPFSLEQILEKKLTNETLIWSEGMESWQKLKDVPEIFINLNRAVPPPPPLNENKIKTEVSGQLNISSGKPPNILVTSINSNKKYFNWLIVWCAFNLFALLMSYSQIHIFNNDGTPDTEEFWPFVKYYGSVTGNFENPNGRIIDTRWGPRRETEFKTVEYFKGIFVNYDWTEFFFYVGTAVIVYFLFLFNKKQNDKRINPFS